MFESPGTASDAARIATVLINALRRKGRRARTTATACGSPCSTIRPDRRHPGRTRHREQMYEACRFRRVASAYSMRQLLDCGTPTCWRGPTTSSGRTPSATDAAFDQIPREELRMMRASLAVGLAAAAFMIGTGPRRRAADPRHRRQQWRPAADLRRAGATPISAPSVCSSRAPTPSSASATGWSTPLRRVSSAPGAMARAWRLSAAPYCQLSTDRGFTSVEVVMSKDMLTRLGLASVAIEVNASLRCARGRGQ